MTRADRVIAAARDVVGVRFRLHGRDPAFGLDCVGLAAWAFRAGGFVGDIPGGYALRGGDPDRFAAALDASGLERIAIAAPGGLVLCVAGPAQFHLAVTVAVAGAGGIIHADSLLRRVVERPGAVPWPLLGAWRLRED